MSQIIIDEMNVINKTLWVSCNNKPAVENEVWRSLKHDPAIEVSNLGRLRLGTYLLPIKRSRGGYVSAVCVNGYREHTHTHTLVMEQFGPPRPHSTYRFTDHQNGRRDDNRICNLRWLTPTLNNLNRRNVKGWTRDRKTAGYLSKITVAGNKLEFGPFEKLDEAFWEYRNAKQRVFEVFDDYNCYQCDSPIGECELDIETTIAAYDAGQIVSNLKNHSLSKYMFELSDNAWYSNYNRTDIQAKAILKSELHKHETILEEWNGLPSDLKKHVLSFHKSELPVVACADCFESFYFLSEDSCCRGPLCLPCSVLWEKEANESK